MSKSTPTEIRRDPARLAECAEHTGSIEDAKIRYSQPAAETHREPSRLGTTLKRVLPWAAVCLITLHWQNTGMMDPAAAVPTLCFCCWMAGIGYGKTTHPATI